MQTPNTTIKNEMNRTAGRAKRPVRAAAFLAAALLVSPLARGQEPIELPAGDAPIADVVIDPVTPAEPEITDAPTTDAIESAKIAAAEAARLLEAELAKPAEIEAAKPAEPAPAARTADAAITPEQIAPIEFSEPALPKAPEIVDNDTAPVTPIGLVEPVKPAPTTLPTAVASAPVVSVIAPAPATRPAEQAVGILENIPADGRINLLVGKAIMLKSRVPFTRVAFSQPDVARDNLLPDGVLLTALKAGSTQLIVWDKDNRTQLVDVVVDVDLNMLTELVKKNFPATDVQLSSANGSLVARGRVPSLATADQIVQLLGTYGKVLNFMEMSGGQQVMLQVRFAEVSRSATTALGVNFGFADGHAGSLGSNVPGGGPFAKGSVGSLTSSVGANVTLFGGGRIGSTEFDIFLSALRNNNLLRVLAEPNLSTVSGKEAQFLAGGEFPIPVPQSGGAGGGGTAITVEYKQFGVRLSFTPVVLGDGKIRLQGTAEVSDLDFTRSVALNGFSIPSLTKRTVTTTIELNEGQTFAVAGLLNNRVTATKQAVPLLGDVPVLGALFRSVRYERNETELVILVTPRLVEGMNPKQVPELPGERWAYPSEADLFLNQYLGGPARDTSNKPGPVMFRGPYGFVPANSAPAKPGVSTVTSVGSERGN
jgi:pilus assembly protein CpaC